jgi:hypothetical protein
MRSNLYNNNTPRENNRVRVYIYTFSGISFILGFLEGIHKVTAYTLLIHVSLGLLFLFLVPLSYKRPVHAILCCTFIQAVAWSAFIVSDPEYLKWMGIKIPTMVLSIVALRIAIADKTQQSLITKKAESQ